MTNEEAVKRLERLIDFSDVLDILALEMAIKALEQQPSEDCISREEALKVMCDKCPMYNCVTKCSSYRHIEKLPSVTPKARWIPVSEEPKEAGSYITTIKYGDKYAVGQRYYHGKYVGWEDSCVIAYMPLPKPYVESEDENNG